MLERFGLEQAGRSVLGSLPYGTCKLLGICRALLTEPSVRGQRPGSAAGVSGR